MIGLIDEEHILVSPSGATDETIIESKWQY